MVFCTYCGQSFTRDEHLERHILTHTNVKPFKCFTCHMSFARRDLLQRHYTVHGKDANNQDIIPAANGMTPRSAGRTPIACHNCAKTKTKCDKKTPCSRCLARGLQCTQRPTRRVTKTVARAGAAPETSASNEAPTSQVVDDAVKPQPLVDSPQEQLASDESGSPNGTSTPLEERRPSSMAEARSSAVLSQPFNASPLNATSLSPEEHRRSSSIGFTQTTPHSGFTDLPQMTRDNSIASSPSFLLDWSQIALPAPFAGLVSNSMAIDPSAVFTPTHDVLGSHPESMLMTPDLTKSMPPPLVTPLETPTSEPLESRFASTNYAYAHPMTQHYQIPPAPVANAVSQAGMEMPAVVAAQGAWSVFRCTPPMPSSSCPKTARLNLEELQQTLRNHEGWSKWTPHWDEEHMTSRDHLTVMQLHESTRDKLLAITQSFLHKALEIHQSAHPDEARNSYFQSTTSTGSNIILLPPARVLEYFLRSYANSTEKYFPLTSRGILDANELMHCHNDRAASLLVLIMIAHGATNIASADARMLTGGLTEACRISLFDLIEKNISMSGNPIVLHAALLFTVQAAWSGDKWQMDIAMGQRGMYFAMLRHSGALERSQASSSLTGQPVAPETLWAEWIQNESSSRLVYSWAMVDQDMSLFHDTAPLFSVTEFVVPMPDSDRLWRASNAAEWSSTFEQVHEFSGGFSSLGSGARPLSLKQLFGHFMDNELTSLGIEMTPLQLRLLLHPLQALVYQFNQLLSCFTDPLSTRNENVPRAISAISTRSRLEEVQSLLQRWYDLAERYLKTNTLCAMMQANLVIFHLISLNAVTDFPEIERFARRDVVAENYQQMMASHRRCIYDVAEAVYHCGQVFRLVRSTPRGSRPPWWAGAIYRAALVLWVESLFANAMGVPQNGGFVVPGSTFPIDTLPPDHPLIVRYLTKREGVACVTRKDGSQTPIDQSFALLQHCVEVIDEGAPTRFTDGIRSKLNMLARAW